MQKSDKSHRFQFKWLVLLFSILLFFVLDSMVFNVRIVNRGIAIGLGIDKDGDYVNLTAQVVLPKNGGVSSGGNNYINYTSRGKSLDQAIDSMGAMTGTEISIAHTVVIVLGRAVIENADYEMLRYLVTTDKVPDNVLLVMADGKASEIMDAKVPVGEVAAYQLFRQMKPIKQPLGMPTVNIKDFIVRTYREHQFNYMPVAHIEPTDPSTDQSKDGADEADMLVIDSTAIMDKTGLVGELDDAETRGFTLAKYKLQDGVIEIDGSDGKPASIQIIDSKPSHSYDYNSGVYRIKFVISTTRLESRLGESGLFINDMDEEELNNFRREITYNVQSVLDFSFQNGVDVLGIRRGFRKFYPKQANIIDSKDFLSSVKLEVSYKIIQR